MKKTIFTIFFTVLTIVTVSAVQVEFTRKINKEFPVGSSPHLEINNKYGNIRIIEGREQTITFKIEIIGKGKNEKSAKELAETVSVEFSHINNRVSAETKLESVRCNNCSRNIHYTVVVPKDVFMDLENKYGDITLDDAYEPLKIDLRYGAFGANKLLTTDIDIQYGKVDIKSCSALNIETRYSDIKIGRVDLLRADSKYDKFNIGSTINFELETGYSDVKIGSLSNRFVADDFKYGKLVILDVSTQFSEIKIDASYSSLQIGLTPDHRFKASLYTKYGEIKAPKFTFNEVELKKEDVIVGIAGSDKNPKASVKISASYGDILLKK